jgi:tRNA threonylcarbamoyladenosine biosynthesis protein TsaE
VRSPTYTLMSLYEAGALTLVHVDLYRLRDPEELEHLGLREWARPACIWLIEWPERAAGRLPRADLTVRLSVAGEAHHAQVDAGTAVGERWLETLRRDS